MTQSITCPNCQSEISIDQALETQVSARIRRELEVQFNKRQSQLAEAQQALQEQQDALHQQEERIEDQIRSKLDSERGKLKAEAELKAREELSLELEDRSAEVAALQKKLSQSQQFELELRKRERELDEKNREFELKVARELQIEREKIRSAALQQFNEEHQLQDAEREKLIVDMRRKIEDLKQRSEQGSVQLQGEVLELALENMLENAFPFDSIVAVGKGVRGADCQQTVRSETGAECGSILWESKRTKNFSSDWLPKLRDDLRESRASIAVLVTQALPDGVDTFSMIDGVWVCSWKCARALAMALRTGLVDLGKAELAARGKDTKMEAVYDYLSGSGFRSCIEAAAEAFTAMQADLTKEKQAVHRLWNKREKQIERAIGAMARMHGDLQGIIGSSLDTIECLDWPRLESV